MALELDPLGSKTLVCKVLPSYGAGHVDGRSGRDHWPHPEHSPGALDRSVGV